MKPETLAALQGSIEKWEKVVDGTGTEDSYRNCPLCQAFIDNVKCHGCPVNDHNDGNSCTNDEMIAWGKHIDDHIWSDDGFRVQCPECIRLAQAELDFLKSLLPKELA